MLRPNNNPNQRHDYGKRLWDQAERNKTIEYVPEKEVFHLSPKEAKKCRYEIINQTERMAECTVHKSNFSHGVRLHPPHLWDLREGKVFMKKGGGWVEWSATVQENKDRTIGSA